MSTPEQRPQDRGYYGAGWQQPAPGQGSGGAAPAAASYAPPRPPRRESDPRRAFAPGASAVNVAGAAIAVVAVMSVEAVSGVFGLLGTSFIVGPFQSHAGGPSLAAALATSVFLRPFAFYVGAFLALAFLTPIARRSPLPVVLLRAVLAGAAGTVALALVGVFTGAYAATRGGGASRVLIDVVTAPLQNGIPLTAMLLASATAAWLWLGRPRGVRRGAGAPGTPGTVRPADAVPPATVQPSAPVQQQSVPQQSAQRQPAPHQPAPQQPGSWGQLPPR